MRFVFFISPLFYFLISLFYTYSNGFFREPDIYTVFYSALDLMLSYFLFLFFVILFKDRFLIYKYKLQCIVGYFENKKSILLILFILSLYFSFYSIVKSISGFSREQLLSSSGFNVYMIVFSIFFQMLTPLILYFNSTTKLKVLSLLSLISAMLYQASMSELLFFGMYIGMLYLIFGGIKIRKILMYISVVLLFAFLVAIFSQSSRFSDSGFFSVINVIVEKVFLYRSFSFYLSDYVYKINDAYQNYSLFYPFLGYLSLTLNKLFASGVDIYNTSFIIKYHFLGVNNNNAPYLANVVYPWWSFFVAQFGILGLLIKTLYVFFLLYVTIKQNLILTTVYILVVLLFLSQYVNPLMTLSSLIYILISVMLDLFFKKKLFSN